MRFYDCFYVYDILMDEECKKISNRWRFVSCISDKLFMFSVYELLKLRQYGIMCCACGSYNIVLICHIYTYINIRTHNTHTHTHTRTQGFCLNFIQSVMACLNFQNTYFRKHLLMAAFIRFRSNCFSEHLKVDAAFIEQPSYFLLGIFLLKNHPENTYLHSHFHEEREFHHCFSSCFHHYFLRRHSSKTFVHWRNIKILISLKRHFQR